jgi:hypothetical protein
LVAAVFVLFGGQSSLQLADAPVLFGDDLDQGRDERDRQNRRLLAAGWRGLHHS